MRLLNDESALEKLKNGLPIIFQTDTLPAIGCLPKFSKKIYEIKKRDFKKPLILMGADIYQLADYVDDSAKEDFEKLGSKFWPGPLTLIIPISKNKTSIVYSIHNSKDNIKENISQLVHQYNFKYKIKKINTIETFDLKSFALKTYYHKNILAFGDLLHKIHPLAGQGFNMSIRDINILMNIIKEKIDLGLPLDISVNSQFEKNSKHTNYIFSNGIDLIHEFFNIERKLENDVFSKSVKLLGKNSYINKFFTNHFHW